ncbi:MAG: Nif3-like dinuclear metal center hexameric protein [Prolixibacteraceae bacterium]|nr:Nif3-like dinuclear metal center hexameric protein [Prolixibacteraceae bacterium]
MKISEIIKYLDSIAPPALQESYDNAGLVTGNPDWNVEAALIAIDVTEKVVEEAVEKNTGLIVAHHPVIFSGIKKITGDNHVERTLIKAIKNDIAIYTAHTNMDAAAGGVNAKICEKLQLGETSVLQPVTGKLKKLVTFIPLEDADRVREAVFNAGAGSTGNYDYCGYSLEGTGSFRGNDSSNPYKGEKGKLHFENEIRFETVFPSWMEKSIINALLNSHPYEEVAYDIYTLDNQLNTVGLGMTGILPEPRTETEFLEILKQTFNSKCIKHTSLINKPVKKVAVCGGSGAGLLSKAIASRADIFVTADFKYHQFFDAEGKILIADIGHYESEQFTKEIFYDLLTKKFPKFAVRFSEVNSNPVFYF